MKNPCDFTREELEEIDAPVERLREELEGKKQVICPNCGCEFELREQKGKEETEL